MKNKNGFNLLTMSAIILILGIVMSATIGFYNINNMKQRVFQNKEKFIKISFALQNYLVKNGRFPCPSSLNCNKNSCINLLDKLGVAKENSNNECIYDNDGVFNSTNSASEKILYGGVPTLTLGIANNYIIDSWGNKIVYIVPAELTKKDSFKQIIYYKNQNIDKQYVKDGILYLLLAFNKNTAGAFSYNNKKSNYFNDNINMPIINFTVNTNNKKFFYFYENYKNFRILGLDEEIQECQEIIIFDEVLNSNFTFPKSKYGEIVFSNEHCPNYVEYPPKLNNYYYLSTYKDSNNIIINNRPAKKCEKNGRLSEDFVHTCVILPKCIKPANIYPLKDWQDFDFEIVNMGIVKDKKGSIEMKCIFSNGEAKWYEIN